jgi:hypothetical protein
VDGATAKVGKALCGTGRPQERTTEAIAGASLSCMTRSFRATLGLNNHNVHASVGSDGGRHGELAGHGHDTQDVELIILDNNSMNVLVPHAAEVRQGQVLGRRKTAHPKAESCMRLDALEAPRHDDGMLVCSVVGNVGRCRRSVAAPKLCRVAVTIRRIACSHLSFLVKNLVKISADI